MHLQILQNPHMMFIYVQLRLWSNLTDRMLECAFEVCICLKHPFCPLLQLIWFMCFLIKGGICKICTLGITVFFFYLYIKNLFNLLICKTNPVPANLPAYNWQDNKISFLSEYHFTLTLVLFLACWHFSVEQLYAWWSSPSVPEPCNIVLEYLQHQHAKKTKWAMTGLWVNDEWVHFQIFQPILY